MDEEVEGADTPSHTVSPSLTRPRASGAGDRGEQRITARPESRRAWLAEMFTHRAVLVMLAKKDFQTRYKRATFGVLWAVAMPALQAAVLAIVFSRVIRPGDTGIGYGAYVMSGMLAWTYFASTVPLATTSIVDSSSLTDKVWFPRALLPTVPSLGNIVGYLVSLLAFAALVPALGGEIGVQILLLLPATVLLLGLTLGLGLVLSALYVYYRDVKFLVQAALLVWLYVSPVIYPRSLLGSAAGWLDLNPMTGVLTLFHASVGVDGDPLLRPTVISAAITVSLIAVGIEVHRRHDRSFVDLL